MLSDKQLKTVCLYGTGANQCRYAFGKWTPNGMKVQCQKLVVKTKKEIDLKVSEHLKNCKKSGLNPQDLYEPIGTGLNCSGFIPLDHVIQGAK